ncbi:MAG: HD-GYP domain-containing protein [Holophagaceae bacterium]|uniref:HD-GYP domain-containing protein n=1 Tax=Candidatus Geothrix skivensis TaxID=2954439 RepID=A0A9D7XGT4_9BACT|nr:HD-GYP domain-containing protein [Candidatus Geothrix skivensis]
MTIKRVRVDQLKPGMYIHDLNCGWLQHGFLRQQFLVNSPGQIEKMHKQGMHEVYIDTGKGADLLGAPTEAEVQQVLQVRLEASGTKGAVLPTARISQKEESGAARRILGEAQGVVKDMMQDVRLGRQVDPEKALVVVDDINASVLRNPGALLSLGRIKQADTYTFQHCVSVCALMVSFSHALGLDAAAVQEAGLGGLLHDMGKMKIPNEILNKPGRLTEEEFTIMKSHAALSRELLEGTPGMSETVIRIASEHHEKLGGCGYPLGLSGDQISRPGRMAAIVDVYDALTSNRVYHKGMEPSEALKKLLEWSGDHLDGELVQFFIRALGIYPVGSLVRLSDDRLAVVVEQQEDLLRPVVRVIYDAARRYGLPPRDLSLIDSTFHIECFEEPADWDLNPLEYL